MASCQKGKEIILQRNNKRLICMGRIRFALVWLGFKSLPRQWYSLCSNNCTKCNFLAKIFSLLLGSTQAMNEELLKRSCKSQYVKLGKDRQLLNMASCQRGKQIIGQRNNKCLIWKDRIQTDSLFSACNLYTKVWECVEEVSYYCQTCQYNHTCVQKYLFSM